MTTNRIRVHDSKLLYSKYDFFFCFTLHGISSLHGLFEKTGQARSRTLTGTYLLGAS